MEEKYIAKQTLCPVQNGNLLVGSNQALTMTEEILPA